MPGILNIKATTWSNYENGITEPDITTLIRISKFFEVSLDDLLTVDLSTINTEEKEIAKKGRPIPEYDLPESVVNEQNPAGQWATFQLLRQIDEKLDSLLLSVKSKPRKKGR